jgi:hypothetical protein
MSDPIKTALAAAAKALCICQGECFATRHGPMNGPCEAKPAESAQAIIAFLLALPADITIRTGQGDLTAGMSGFASLAAAVKAAGLRRRQERAAPASFEHPREASCRRKETRDDADGR